MIAEDTRDDVWFLIFHISHLVMNEFKHCECKKSNQITQMWLLRDFFANEFILLYHLQI
jgi:hypothetical protein